MDVDGSAPFERSREVVLENLPKICQAVLGEVFPIPLRPFQMEGMPSDETPNGSPLVSHESKNVEARQKSSNQSSLTPSLRTLIELLRVRAATLPVAKAPNC